MGRLSVLIFALCPALVAQTVVPITNGGTGAKTAAAALSNLGAAAASSGVPSGMIVFIKTGTCPSGWTEDDTLATFNVLVTTTAAADVGTTGGSNSYTPAGSASVGTLTAAAQTFTGSSTTVPAETVNSLTAAAQTFTGTSAQVTSAVSGGTPAGTVTAPTFTGTAATLVNAKFTVSSTGTAVIETIAGSNTTYSPVGTNSVPTFSGSALATHTHTLTPGGTNSTSAVTGTLNSTTLTPLGTNGTSNVTGTINFSGTPATIRQPYFKVIACAKN